MDLREYNLRLDLQAYMVPGVLKALLHTIVFLRAVGNVQPIDETLEFLDVTYVRCDDKQVERMVASRVDVLTRTFHQSGSHSHRAVLKFSKRNSGGMMSRPVVFEQWLITLNFLASPTRESEKLQAKQRVEADLRNALVYVMTMAMQDRAHLPNIDDGRLTVPFDFSIEASSDARGGSGWASTLYNVFSAPPGT